MKLKGNKQNPYQSASGQRVDPLGNYELSLKELGLIVCGQDIWLWWDFVESLLQPLTTFFFDYMKKLFWLCTVSNSIYDFSSSFTFEEASTLHWQDRAHNHPIFHRFKSSGINIIWHLLPENVAKEKSEHFSLSSVEIDWLDFSVAVATFPVCCRLWLVDKRATKEIASDPSTLALLTFFLFSFSRNFLLLQRCWLHSLFFFIDFHAESPRKRWKETRRGKAL